MKTFRTVFAVIVVALLMAAFAPIPGIAPVAASNTVATTSAPAQSFVKAALGLPLLSPMTVSASAPVISVVVEAATNPYACKLTAQTPVDWTKMRGRQIFDAKWTLQNTGTKPWPKASVDYKYLSGAKLHTHKDAYDLPKSVWVGKKTDIVVDMMAPKYNGTYTWYTARWGLVTGSTVFCRFSITIVVNR
ncbi:MAG: hypothetical protein EHM81_05970 [Chloroflexi bacterium]|nr:MAG: hypothetical protein EHM81_05970 [Chloroflexota bacterium]